MKPPPFLVQTPRQTIRYRGLRLKLVERIRNFRDAAGVLAPVLYFDVDIWWLAKSVKEPIGVYGWLASQSTSEHVIAEAKKGVDELLDGGGISVANFVANADVIQSRDGGKSFIAVHNAKPEGRRDN